MSADFISAARDLFGPKPTAPAPVAYLPAGTGTGYAGRALEAEVQRVMDAPQGSRNGALNTAAFSLGQLVAGGALPEGEVVTALTAAARAIGLDEHEIAPTISSGLTAGAEKPRGVPERPDRPAGRGLDLVLPELAAPALTVEQDVTFWTERPVLQHLHTFARARRVSPWALLGVAVTRAITTVPPHIVLPALVGGVGSLNTFVALVGPSGAGKGAAESAGKVAIDHGDIFSAVAGSGEGLAHLYAHREKREVVRDRDAVLLSVPEVDTLSALTSRQGATLMPILRSTWSGEAFGFAYADPTKALPIAGHSYRLCMLLGVQPGRAGALLDDSDGGTPQRFLWLPTTDPGAPDVAPECPDPIPGKHISWRTAGKAEAAGLRSMTIPDVARAAIDGARLDRLRNRTEALDGHALLARLKLAAGLAVLDGRPVVEDDDWRLSGVVMSMSDHTRSHIQDELKAVASADSEARGKAEGRRAAVADDTKAEHAIATLAKWITTKVRSQGTWLASDLRRKARSDRRAHFDEAVDRLLAAKVVTLIDDGNGPVLALTEVAS